MNEEGFNLSVRQFLKSFGVQAQHEIEQAVAGALASRAITESEKLPGKITLEIPGLKLRMEIPGEIALG